jgi:hypothetical protein
VDDEQAINKVRELLEKESPEDIHMINGSGEKIDE